MAGWGRPGVRRLLAVGLLTLASAPPSAQAAFPGTNGDIAFTSDRDGNQEVYVMHADGSGQTNLSRNAAGDTDPSFSPDGRRIVFASNRPGFQDVFAMNADGSGQTNLTNTGGDDIDPSFSPDGSKVLYARSVGGYDIFAMNADGSGPADLTNNAYGELVPAYAPNGSRIAFMRNVASFDVWSMNPDGSGATDLTNDNATDTNPSYSPDGGKIAFQTDRDGNDEIYVMNADGSAPTDISNNPASDTSPSFSPDGTKIAFVSDRTGNAEVFTMNVDGSGQTDISNNPAADTNPNWGPAPAPKPPPPPTTTTPPATTPTPPATTPTPSPPHHASPSPPPSANPTTPAATPLPAPAPIAPATAQPSATARAPRPRTRHRQASTPAPKPKAARPPASAAPPRPAPPPPSKPRPRHHRRPEVAAALERPDTVPVGVTDIARSLGLAILLVALLGLPARVFNSSWKDNRHEIAAFLARAGRVLGRLVPGRGAILATFAGTSVVVGSIVHWFLNPGFPTRAGSFAFALGMLFAFAAIVALQVAVWRWYIRRRLPEVDAGWHVYSAQIAVSVVCVAVSRLAHFVPGLFLGMSGDYEPHEALSIEHLGRRAALSAAALGVVSLAAWGVSIPVARAAAHPGAPFGTLVLDSALTVVSVAGMETLVFTMAPFQFLDGYDVFRWRPLVWALLWGSGVAWFALVVLNPALSHYQGEARASGAWLAALLGIEALAAISIWTLFVVRRRRVKAAA